MNFDWRTDDDGETPEQLDEGTGVIDERGGRRWPWLIAFILLVLAGGYLLWREANERVAAAQAAAEEEVRSSHRLVQRAVAGGDKELLLSLLSGRDIEWLGTQLEQLKQDRLAGPLGLSPAGEGQIVSVELDAEFAEAVLVAQQPYIAVAGESGGAETVILEHSYVYRRGEQRWLLSPPKEAYWGDAGEQQWRGERISMSYRERDAEVALRLGRTLDELLDQLCNFDGMHCPAGERLRVTFATNPESSAALDRLQVLLAPDEEQPATLVLPSPTLIGTPVDDAGYEVLLRAYARPIVVGALALSLEYDCCRGIPFFSALVERQLSRLGVAEWPLGADEYEALLAQGIDTLSANRILTSTELESGDEQFWREALALVEFLEAEMGPEQLLAEGRSAYGSWLEQHNDDPDRFVAAWLGFIHSQTDSGQRALSAMPEGSVQFSCRTLEGVFDLIAYDFASEAWREVLQVGPPERNSDTSAGFVDVVTLPGDYGHIIQEYSYGGMLVAESGRVAWRPEAQDGEAQEEIVIQEWVSGRDTSTRPRLIGYHPSGRYLIMTDFVLPFRSNIPFTGPAWLVDLEDCDRDGCGPGSSSTPALPLVGTPVWSPDGQRTLLQGQVTVNPGTGQIQYELHLADQEGQNPEPVGVGLSPFWLNEDYFGYLRILEEGAQELVVAAVQEGASQDGAHYVVADMTAFREAVAASEGTEPRPMTYLGNIQVINASVPQLLILAHSPGPGEAMTNYAFLVTLTEPDSHASVELLLASNAQILPNPSPDGRWLSVREFDPVAGWENSNFSLINLESGDQQPLGTGGDSLWSTDGRWLVRSYDSYFLLWEVETGRSVMVEFERPRPDCDTDIWVEGQE